MKQNLNDFDYSQLDKLGDLEHKRVLSVIHPSDQFIRLQTEQLMSQMGLAERKDNNPYDYNDFLTVAKHSCIRANKAYNNSESKMTIFTRAMMTSDFPALLVSVTNKLLSQGWTNATTTYQDWAGTATVKDFKTASLISMSSFSKLNKIQEGEEITNGGMSSESESFKLETFAKMFSVSRRSYINDELEVLKRITASDGIGSETDGRRNGLGCPALESDSRRWRCFGSRGPRQSDRRCPEHN